MNPKIISGITSLVSFITSIVFFIIFTKQWANPNNEEEKDIGMAMTFIAIILLLLSCIVGLMMKNI